MRKKWRSITAICLAVLLGCLIPMGTMKAEENDLSVADSDRDEDTDADGNSDAGEAVDGDEDSAIDESDDAAEADGELSDGPAGEDVGAAETAGDLPDGFVTEGIDVPEIAAYSNDIALLANYQGIEADVGVTVIYDKGGEKEKVLSVQEVQNSGFSTDYIYIDGNILRFRISTTFSEGTYLKENEGFFYYLDASGDDARPNFETIDWIGTYGTNEYSVPWNAGDGKYVIYIKAARYLDDRLTKSYVVSQYVVVDTTAPVITDSDDNEIRETDIHRAGDEFGFKVTDANLDSVDILDVRNNEMVDPVIDGQVYKFTLKAGTHYTITATDKAGNVTTRGISVSVTGELPPSIEIIQESGSKLLYSYTPYRLGAGSYTVGGDPTVYRGNNEFYVKASSLYTFTKK